MFIFCKWTAKGVLSVFLSSNTLFASVKAGGWGGVRKRVLCSGEQRKRSLAALMDYIYNSLCNTFHLSRRRVKTLQTNIRFVFWHFFYRFRTSTLFCNTTVNVVAILSSLMRDLIWPHQMRSFTTFKGCLMDTYRYIISFRTLWLFLLSLARNCSWFLVCHL